MYVMEYGIVRFSPFVETEEFANIGIVLIAPEVGFFGSKIQSRKYSRITNFFDPLPRDIYLSATRQLNIELSRIAKVSANYSIKQRYFDFGEKQITRLVFQDLLRRKEGAIRFSPVKLVLAADPQEKLQELYRHYVDREFATPVYNERLLELEVRGRLQDFDLARDFSSQKVGDGTYQARFPFVKTLDGSIKRIIKPLFLGQERPEAIIDHGNKWAYTVTRLRKAGVLPKEILFPIRPPKDGQKRLVAYKEAIELLNGAGVSTILADEKAKIIEYALG